MHLQPMKIISVPLNKLAYSDSCCCRSNGLGTEGHFTHKNGWLPFKGQLWAGNIDYNMALKGKNTAYISSLAVYLMAVLKILSSTNSPLEGLGHLDPIVLLGTFMRAHDERSGNAQVANKLFFWIRSFQVHSVKN